MTFLETSKTAGGPEHLGLFARPQWPPGLTSFFFAEIAGTLAVRIGIYVNVIRDFVKGSRHII